MAKDIQVDYGKLSKAAQTCDRQGDDIGRMLKAIVNQVDELRSGGWIGKGADAFYAEMQNEVEPALNRLVAALQQAADVMRAIAYGFSEAEQETAHLFSGEGAAAGAGGGVGSRVGLDNGPFAFPKVEGNPANKFAGDVFPKVEGNPAGVAGDKFAKFEGNVGDKFAGDVFPKVEGNPANKFAGDAFPKVEGNPANKFAGDVFPKVEGNQSFKVESHPPPDDGSQGIKFDSGAGDQGFKFDSGAGSQGMKFEGGAAGDKFDDIDHDVSEKF